MLGMASYPSSETMALLILEEFVLASFILLIGIFLKKPEIVAAVTLGHTLHLLSHLSELFRFHTWVPGTITAALTLPILLIVLCNFFKNKPYQLVTTQHLDGCYPRPTSCQSFLVT